MALTVINLNENISVFNHFLIHEKNKEDKTVYDVDGLEKISLFTTDQGPIIDDVALALFFGETILVLQSEHGNYQEIYDFIGGLFEFNYENVIKAMCSTENAEFILWKKGND